MNKYEIMYIVNASLDDEAREKVANSLNNAIIKNGGSIDSTDNWGIKEFAYEIDHMKKGYYTVINVTANAEGVAEFDRVCRINNSVIRSMIIKMEK